MTDYAMDVNFNARYIRLFFNSNYGSTDFYWANEVAVYTC